MLAASVSIAVSRTPLWSSDGTSSAWSLAFLAPAAAASVAVCIDARGRTALVAGAVGVAASFWLFLELAARYNGDVYEPLLTDVGLATLIAIVGLLPVPLIALSVWAWRSARSPGTPEQAPRSYSSGRGH